MNRILVYKSQSGNTERYAQWIAQETGCKLLPWREATPAALSGCDALVFGGRLRAGSFDGLKKARKLYEKSGARRFIVFATGAMPNDAGEEIEAMWRKNLTAKELDAVPHFYMQAGMCLERLGRLDRSMLKVAASFIAKQAEKDPEKAEMLKAFQTSYDICDRQYIAPLVELLNRSD